MNVTYYLVCYRTTSGDRWYTDSMSSDPNVSTTKLAYECASKPTWEWTLVEIELPE